MSDQYKRCEEAIAHRLAKSAGQTHVELANRMADAYDAAARSNYPVDEQEHLVTQRGLLAAYIGSHKGDAAGAKHVKTTKVPAFDINVGGVKYAFNEGDAPTLNDNVVKVEMKALSNVNVPAAGEWSLSVHAGDVSVVTRIGKYDFKHAAAVLASADGNVAPQFVTLRVPVFAQEQLVSRRSALGVTEIVLTARLQAGDVERVQLSQVLVLAVLTPDDKWYGGNGTVVDTTAASATGRMPTAASFVRPEESAQLQSGSGDKTTVVYVDRGDAKMHVLVLPKPAATSGDQKRTGAQVAAQFVDTTTVHTNPNVSATLVVVGAGGNVAHAEGPDAESLVRLAEVSTPLSNVALRSYHAKANPAVDLSAPGSATALLRAADAGHVADALEKCYARIGTSAPTMEQLLDGSSGLPNHMPITRATLKRVEAAFEATRIDGDSAAQENGGGDDDVDTLTDDNYNVRQVAHMAQVLSDNTTPMHAPGMMATPSQLAYSVLRCTLPEWQNDGPERIVEAQLVALGVDSATFTADGKKKPMGAAYANDTTEGKELLAAEQGIASLSSGLYATPSDLGRFFSDRNPWYSTLMGHVKPVAAEHAHMTHALEPVHTLRSADGEHVNTDALGLVHTTVDYCSFPLRIASVVGRAQGAQTVAVSVVPRLHAAVVLTTTAPPGALARSNGSMVGFAQRLVGFSLDQVHDAGQVFVNDQAAAHMVEFAPDDSAALAALEKHNASAVQHCFSERDLATTGLAKFVGRTMVSLADDLCSGDTGSAVPSVVLTKHVASAMYGAGAPADTFALTLDQRHPGGDASRQPIALDKTAVDPHNVAGRKNAGALRALNPATSYAGEFVTLTKLGGRDALLHMGRLYVEESTAHHLKVGRAHALFVQQEQRKAVADAAVIDPYAPQATSDVSGIYDTVKDVGSRRGGPGRRWGHHKYRHRRGHRGRAYGSFGARVFGGVLGSLLYPTVYRPVPYGYYPVPPGYWRPGYY